MDEYLGDIGEAEREHEEPQRPPTEPPEPPSEYPTEDCLKFIAEYDIIKGDPLWLINYVQNCWHWGEDCFKIRGKNILSVECSTGGWSGNEDVIGALKSNRLFWMTYWVRSERGGHYWFKVHKIPTKEEAEKQQKARMARWKKKQEQQS